MKLNGRQKFLQDDPSWQHKIGLLRARRRGLSAVSKEETNGGVDYHNSPLPQPGCECAPCQNKEN